MKTETTWHIGSAHRLADGSISRWLIGQTEFRDLAHAKAYIANLIDSYKARGVEIRANEFIPARIETTFFVEVAQ